MSKISRIVAVTLVGASLTAGSLTALSSSVTADAAPAKVTHHQTHKTHKAKHKLTDAERTLKALGYKPVDKSLAKALKGYDVDHPKRNWTRCWVKYGDTTRIACPDGKVFVS